MGISTRVDLNHDRIMRSHDLDEIARLLFPGSRDQQRLFVAVCVELKWADGQFLAKLEPVADQYGLSRRVLETVRAKMRRLGVIDHVSRFNKRWGYREGWVFSQRMARGVHALVDRLDAFKARRDGRRVQRDRDLVGYL